MMRAEASLTSEPAEVEGKAGKVVECKDVIDRVVENGVILGKNGLGCDSPTETCEGMCEICNQAKMLERGCRFGGEVENCPKWQQVGNGFGVCRDDLNLCNGC